MYMPMEIFNIVLLCLLAAIPVALLIVTARPGWGDSRAYATSMRARLPFGTEDVHRSVRTRLRRILRINMWGFLGAIVVMGTLFLTTPLASTPYAMWMLTLLILVVVLAGGTLVGQLRERLFSPAPAAPRIARAVALDVRDYVGTWGTLTPVVILVAAVATTVGVAVATAAGRLTPTALLATLGALALAVATTVATRFAERRVLAQPQPARDTLELAWDDLFRRDALSSLRMSAAMTAWLPFGMGAALLVTLLFADPSPQLDTLFGLFPWWGIPALQVVYTIGAGKLPASLSPAFLREPEPVAA